MLQYMKTFDIWKHAANMTTSVYTKPPEQSNGNCFWRLRLKGIQRPHPVSIGEKIMVN